MKNPERVRQLTIDDQCGPRNATKTRLTDLLICVSLPRMARPLRIEFAGATYHVMARGNQGQKICVDDHAPRRTPRQPHDQSRAEAMLAAGLRALGIRSGDLATLPKGQREKLVLAWWLYGQTTVRRRWVAEQLRMGYETRVSQAVRLVKSSRKRVIKEMKNKLDKCGI